MIPGQIDGFTNVLGAPREWDEARDGPCGALHIRRDPGNRLLSAWTPTQDELAALNAGGSVILSVVGTGHPPVWIAVVAPDGNWVADGAG